MSKRFYIVTRRFNLNQSGYDKDVYSSDDPKKLLDKAIELLGPLSKDDRLEAGMWLERRQDVPGSCGPRLNLNHMNGMSVLVESIEI